MSEVYRETTQPEFLDNQNADPGTKTGLFRSASVANKCARGLMAGFAAYALATLADNEARAAEESGAETSAEEPGFAYYDIYGECEEENGEAAADIIQEFKLSGPENETAGVTLYKHRENEDDQFITAGDYAHNLDWDVSTPWEENTFGEIRPSEPVYMEAEFTSGETETTEVIEVDYPCDDEKFDDNNKDDETDDENGDDRVGSGGRSVPIRTFAGDHRYATATALSGEFFDAANTTVVATGENYADALTATPLAGVEEAPLLLTGSEQLPEDTSEEINRLGSERVIVVGGTAAVSAQVEAELQSLPDVDTVDRAGGRDRFETATEVADMMDPRVEIMDTETETETAESDEETTTAEADTETTTAETDDDPTAGEDRVYLVSGTNFPDAVTISGTAAKDTAPILLATEHQLPEATQDYLETNRGRFDRVVVVGGESAVNSNVAGAASSTADAPAERLAGSTRFETSKAVATDTIDRYGDMEEVFVATGADYPDALTAGSAMAASEDVAITSLIHGQESSSVATWGDFYERHKTELLRRVTFVGGNAAINGAVKNQYSITVDAPEDNPTSDSTGQDTAAATSTVASSQAGTNQDVNGQMADAADPIGQDSKLVFYRDSSGKLQGPMHVRTA